MKQITPEIKQRIFALYWGQKVCRAVYPHEGEHIDKVGQWNIHHITNLELSPLSSITDEDAIEVMLNGGRNTYKTNLETIIGRLKTIGYIDVDKWDYFPISVWDYLRSKGYALPAFGYSVDELVEVGVFKIKEVNND